MLSISTNTTTVHTVGTSVTQFNEVYLWANNVSGTAATMTLQFGTSTSDRICNALSIPANSPPVPIVSGQNVTGGVSLTGYSDTANAINVQGYINVIS